MAEERASWATERGTLLQRLQAPEQAIVDHSLTVQHSPPAPAVAMDDDAGQRAALGIELSKDELADREYMAELA